MSRISGKKLTRAQRKILANNGIKDASDWLYVKQETIDSSGAKSAALNRSKIIIMVIQNVVTGEIKRFEMP